MLVLEKTGAMNTLSFGLVRSLPVARNTLVAEMRDGFLALDADGTVIDANEAMERVLGRPTSALVGQPIGEVVPAAAPEETAHDDDLVVSVDGMDRHFDLQRTDTTGNRSRAAELLVFRDITDTRRIEKRHSRLIEESSDLVTVFGEDGTIEYVSPSVRGVLGYEPDAVQGEPVTAFSHEADRERVVTDIETLLEQAGGSITFEHRLRRADGSWALVESKARNFVDDPVIGGIAVNSRDVTDRERRERRLEAQNERLDQFTSVVSHDLRNPLGVAQGYLELGQQTGDEAAFEEVTVALGRMERMIDELLTLAREGRTIAETRPVDVERVALDAWRDVSGAMGRIRVDTPGSVTADEARLRELFENLFRNSVEHGSEHEETPESGVVVTVGGTDTGFFVADDGPGIPAAARDQVFEFGHTTTATGTGFGLSIVHRIAEAHDWMVGLTESDGGGVRFEFDTTGAGGAFGCELSTARGGATDGATTDD
ncbi:PAS domain-containing sensor histidine kinase [Haloarchaeobius sp. DT45]|uniref:PAS domain-containing sensor histidine kinase n=1 Tax=Haloarchaeobius sp. DT45 TaxID=3446116 RepID=UPI003F6CD6B9